jgi:hypothetical protein
MVYYLPRCVWKSGEDILKKRFFWFRVGLIIEMNQ